MNQNMNPTSQENPANPIPKKQVIEGVQRVLAISSAKGGVGKSTLAVNLAFALKQLGANIGLLDADIYGPSIPTMLGITKKPSPDVMGRIRAVMAHGIPLMSIGFMVQKGQPLIWRGPVLFQVLQQFFHEVKWTPYGTFLDFLIVDLPPGTGDIQLSMAQQVTVDGAIIVTTPQDVALADVERGIALFKMADVPVMGIVENMSHFLCPHCHERTDIFSNGGAQRIVKEHGIPLLGEIPLEPAIRECGDQGLPTVLKEPDSPRAAHYLEIARKILKSQTP